jgi:aspartyl-tRNA synthetase
MHLYRTHSCNDLKAKDVGSEVKLSGWVNRKRDHSNVLFIDLRDHYGITQCVVPSEHPFHKVADDLSLESVICVTGKVIERDANALNSKLPTGEIEVMADTIEVLSHAEQLPLQVNSEKEFPEETRLKYRFLDLRKEKMHHNIVLRSQIITTIRSHMTSLGFLEYQTPILTSSSPEGARDFLVPSRVHPGCFYALPQAPQQFKQLLMVAGFDRYFQIAPCFRDEDARADRSPGEFYQLDMEMSFVTQEDVLNVVESVLHNVFEKFSNTKKVTSLPFPRISYQESMAKYGSDKPDLRNPLLIYNVDSIFKNSGFTAFSDAIKRGEEVRAIPVNDVIEKPRSFFEKLNKSVQDAGGAGLGYILFEGDEVKGPIAKFLDTARIDQLRKDLPIQNGSGIFFICGPKTLAQKLSSFVRTSLCNELDLLEKDVFKFCWVVDFPMFELDEKTNKVIFSHNPFSMPQGGLEALQTKDPLEINAYQYDIVCNGIELSSGAIRNHLPEVMFKAFSIAGYSKEDVESQFGGMLRAFQYGAPPHGGCAPGIDRIVMLLADEPNIREVVAFPLNQQAQDLLMNAPAQVPDHHLQELHLRIKYPAKEVQKETS